MIRWGPLVLFLGIGCAANPAQRPRAHPTEGPPADAEFERNHQPSGYDGNNWPASLVMDTANISSEAAAQHDLFYGGGGASSAAFDEGVHGTTSTQAAPTSTESTRRTTAAEFRTTERTTTERSTSLSRNELHRVTSTTAEPKPAADAAIEAYRGEAVHDSRHDAQQQNEEPNPYQSDGERIVAKLHNIDRLTQYTLDDADTKPESVEKPETTSMKSETMFPSNTTISEAEDVANTTLVEDRNVTASAINEILSRPLDTLGLDQAIKDENLDEATRAISRLLHDDKSHQTARNELNNKATKRVRIFTLPPLDNEDESEEIIIVGQRGNATIHRSYSSIYIQTTGAL